MRRFLLRTNLVNSSKYLKKKAISSEIAKLIKWRIYLSISGSSMDTNRSSDLGWYWSKSNQARRATWASVEDLSSTRFLLQIEIKMTKCLNESLKSRLLKIVLFIISFRNIHTECFTNLGTLNFLIVVQFQARAFSILPQLPPKIMLDSKVVKINPKNNPLTSLI